MQAADEESGLCGNFRRGALVSSTKDSLSSSPPAVIHHLDFHSAVSCLQRWCVFMSASALIALPDVLPSFPKRRPAPASVADQPRFPLARHRFVLTSLLVCLRSGSVETIEHAGVPAIVLSTAHGLRNILTAEGEQLSVVVAASEMGQLEYLRHKFFRERLQRKRRAKSIGRCDSGETSQEAAAIAAAVPVSLSSRFPSIQEWTNLSRLGYPVESIVSTLCRRLARPDRRKRCVVDYDGDKNDSHNGKAEATDVQKGHCNIAQPNHPYVPAALSCRTFTGGGIRVEQVTQAIAAHRWDDATSHGVFEIVTRKKSAREVARERGLPAKRLGNYATIVRNEIRSDPHNFFAE